MTRSTARSPRWRRRLQAALLIVLAANLLVFGSFTLPRLLRDRRLADHVLVLRTEQERARRNVAQLRQRADAIQANTRDLARFYADVVPELPTAAVVLKDLEQATPSAGDRSWSRQAVKGAPLVRFTVSMPISGSYGQLLAFLETLERFPHFVTVERVALRDKAQASAAELDVVVAAWFKAEKAAGGEASGAR